MILVVKLHDIAVYHFCYTMAGKPHSYLRHAVMVRQEMTSSKAVVETLLTANPQVRKQGFAKAMRALSDSRFFIQAAKAIVPDAYLINDDEVVLYEVADTHPIRPEKARRIAALAEEVEETDRLLRVVVLDYTGHVIADTPGWSYGASHTDEFASEACMDITPAARAAYREAHSRTK